VVRYQRSSGGWPKNIDMARPLSAADRAALGDERALNDTTIDNGATTTQIRFLAKVLAATGDAQWRAPMAAGLDWLLAAQYANGGWPQYFPLRTDYSRHITFNDDAMVNVLLLLDDVAEDRAPMDVAPPPVRARARAAVTRGTDVLLRTQISVAGSLTGWCQQHDEVTLKPAPARAYEHVSISGKETVGIVRFLMRIERPDARVIAAIDGAAAWLAAVQVKGTRIDRQPAVGAVGGMDVVLVPDASAAPLWARFYEIGTNKPIFSGRDGVIRYNLSEIELERRSGYSWIGTYASALLQTEYPAWRKRLGRTT
jgi:PelA/Pel-15E family pectate lyase